VRKKERRVRPADAVFCYILQLEDWAWSYSFGVTDPRYDGQRYHRHMLVRGGGAKLSVAITRAMPHEMRGVAGRPNSIGERKPQQARLPAAARLPAWVNSKYPCSLRAIGWPTTMRKRNNSSTMVVRAICTSPVRKK